MLANQWAGSNALLLRSTGKPQKGKGLFSIYLGVWQDGFGARLYVAVHQVFFRVLLPQDNALSLEYPPMPSH